MKIFQFIIKGKTGLKDYCMVREFTRDKVTTRAKEKEDNNIPISNIHH